MYSLLNTSKLFFRELLFANVITANDKNNRWSLQVQYSPTEKVQGRALISSFPPSPQTEVKKDNLSANST